MSIVLPTKKYMIELQPEGKTILRMQWHVVDPKRVKSYTPEEAKNALIEIARFENSLSRLKMEIMNIGKL